jgi:Zn finger protein HypA/HybF involved in hydrogenase expression
MENVCLCQDWTFCTGLWMIEWTLEEVKKLGRVDMLSGLELSSHEDWCGYCQSTGMVRETMDIVLICEKCSGSGVSVNMGRKRVLDSDIDE